MNINELKQKLQTLNRKTDKQNDIWKPKDEHTVRGLRAPGEPLQEYAAHYNIGDVINLPCPKKNYGEDCAICDFADTLRAWKDEKGREKPEKIRKEDFEIFKKIQAVSKMYLPIVVRGEDGKTVVDGPKWWGLTANQAQQVLEVCTDADRLRECDIDPDDAENAIGAITSPKKAFDLSVSFAKPGEKGNTKTFTQVTIKGKYKPSPLTGNAEKDAEILSKIKPLKDVFPKVSSAEVKKALDKFLGAGAKAASAEPTGSDEKYASKTNSKEDAKKPGKRTVDEAFADLDN